MKKKKPVSGSGLKSDKAGTGGKLVQIKPKNGAENPFICNVKFIVVHVVTFLFAALLF